MHKFKNNKSEDLKRNGSGCSEPTAHKAIKRVDAEKERLDRVLNIIWNICDVAGFKVEDRIVLKDIKTGKIWRWWLYARDIKIFE